MGIYTSVLTKKEVCASNTTKTLIQLHNGLQGQARIIEYGISFDGINSNSSPARVRLVRQTTGGTMTQVGAGGKYDSGVTASNASWRFAASSEPTTTTYLETHQITPIGGTFFKQYPLGREPILQAGERIGLQVNPALGSATSALAYIVWEE